MLPNDLVITGFSFVFATYIRCISIARSFYFTVLQASFLVSFLSPEFATSINVLVLFSLSRIVMCGLFVKEASVDLQLLIS